MNAHGFIEVAILTFAIMFRMPAFHCMKSYRLALLVSLALSVPLLAQDQGEITKLLKQLQSQNIDTRQRAMFELQPVLDPRVPDACLPVLKMEGESIRRLAARAIGSRWHQISKERVP